MTIVIAVILGGAFGALIGQGTGAVAGALLGWLVFRSVRQQRQIDALRQALEEVKAAPSVVGVPATLQDVSGEAIDVPLEPSGIDLDLGPELQTPSRQQTPEAVDLVLDAQPEVQPAVPAADTRASKPPRTPPPMWNALRGWLFGGNTIVKAGIGILFIGLAFLAKFASEHVQVPVEFRLASIAGVALLLLGIGWRLRLRRAGYAQALQGGAIAVLYLTLFVAFRFYGVLSAPPVFAMMVLVAALAAAGVMEWALLSHDFSLRYVAENNATGTPLLYTITGLWAALEGSILLWAVILGGYLTFVAVKFRKRAQDPLVAVAIITGLAVALFFFALMLGPANPFRELSTVPFDGRGPNPLLQNHVLMAFHPPILYLGYVGFTVPFMFGIAALVTGRFGEGWLSDTRRATLVAWGFLTLGIILGAWWSYEVLGWGGFWAWDPVENASFLPWLTATAFIHSVIVQERRGMLRVWNLSLVIATFCLTILGTFLTRSGVIDSVHAFTQSDIGPWLLTFFGVVAATGIGLIAWRGDKLRAPGRIDSAVSRESAFLMNNLLFAALAFVVLLGTVFPLIAEALRGSRLSVGEPYFDRMATPIGLALLFLMAAAPALPWRATSGEVVRNRLLVPAWIGGLTMLVAVVLGARGLAEIVAYGLGAFATAGIVRQFVLGIRGRRRALGESRAVALGRATRSNPRLYGGLVVHFGVVLIAVVLAASSAYGANRDVKLKRGESATVSGYTVTYLRSHQSASDQKVTVSADIEVRKGDRVLGTYAPAISTYPNSTEGIGTPSVHTGLVDDVYLTLVSSPNDQREITLGVRINALIVWLWIGGAFMALGTILALAPRLRRRPRSIQSDDLAPTPVAASDGEPEPDAREEVPV